MNWKNINTELDIEEIITQSFYKPQGIFKHSTRCSISTVAKQRIDKNDDNIAIEFNYLDLIAQRNISNLIAQKFDVEHQSPQILIIKKGVCVFDESHGSIDFNEIVEQANL
jgi:bacillithiol system protein YtxJ